MKDGCEEFVPWLSCEFQMFRFSLRGWAFTVLMAPEMRCERKKRFQAAKHIAVTGEQSSCQKKFLLSW